jgi:segregation and condensation protein B
LQKTENRPNDIAESTQDSQQDGRVKQELELIEAALYVAGRPLDINELCSVINTRSKNKTRKLAKRLIQQYSERSTALEILELKDERYVLQLKSAFTLRVKRFVNRPLLSMGPLKTLSYIAYRQPVSQKRVVDVRGHHAYGHVKLLKEMDLVTSERSGRSSVLKTTEYFADYFALSHDTTTVKRELKQIFEEDEKKGDVA